jgi:Uncharacterized protein conserved in bacteria (DUF2188)
MSRNAIKMRKRNQHVIPLGNGWAVKEEGKTRFSLISQTQKDAIHFARQIAKSNRAELVIHRKDGRIRLKDNYVNGSTPQKEKQY